MFRFQQQRVGEKDTDKNESEALVICMLHLLLIAIAANPDQKNRFNTVLC